jgi:hypothetical protein
MTIPKWAKITRNAVFSFLGVVWMAGAGVSGVGNKDLKEALSKYDGKKVTATMQMQKQDTQAALRAREDADIHIALFHYCSHENSVRTHMLGYQTVDGHELIRDKGDHFVVWQTGKQQQDTLQKVFAEIDPETKLQVCATYDVKNKDLSVHFGGTNFHDYKDMFQAGVMLAGGVILPGNTVTQRSAKGAGYSEAIIEKWQELNPGLSPEEINVSLWGHSSGAASVAPSMVAFAANGFKVNAAYLVSPCGAKGAFDEVAELTGVSPEELEKNVMTIDAKDKGILGVFKHATAPVNEAKDEICDAAGHRAIHFVDVFNAKKAGLKKDL